MDKDLRWTDSDGVEIDFAYDPDHGVAVVDINSRDGCYLGEQNARALVDWLAEHFGLTHELTAVPIGVDPGLEITVETETGKTRTVRWYGPDVPGELVRLSEIALRVRPQVTPDEDATLMLGHINMMVRELGLRGVHLDAFAPVESVRILVDAYRTLRREAAGPRPVPQELTILRQLCVMLGLERVADIPTRVEKLIAEVNAVAGALADATGTTIGPDGVSLPGLVKGLRQRHALEISKLKAGHYDAIRRAEEEYSRREQEALAKERDVRAAVQVELDRAREALRNVGAKITADAGPNDELAQALLRIVFEELEATPPDA